MNIGPLLRSVVGDARPGTPQKLELKAGQVVRGTVLSVSEDGQEAVIQVQGVKLHAALETPLQEGQTTLLQVQPQTEDGLLKLKPVQTLPSGSLSAASLTNALETLGLDNTPGNREMLQLMQTNGIPLTKENVAQLMNLNAQKPASVPMPEWIHAVGIAINRGLPLTGETVTGLHQAVFGPPLHTLLSALEEQLVAWVQREAAVGSPAPGGGKEQAGMGTAGSHGTAVSGGAGTSGAMEKAAAEASGMSLADKAAGSVASGTGTLAGGISSAGGGQSVMQALTQSGNKVNDQLLMKLQQVIAELKGAVLLEGTATGESSPAPNGTTGTPAASGQALAKGTPAAAGAEPAATALPGEGPAGPSPQVRPAPMTESWVGRVLKLLGAEHEQQVLRAGASGEPASTAPPAGGVAQQAAAGGGGAQAAAPAPTLAPAQSGGALPGSGPGPEAALQTPPPRGDVAGAAAPAPGGPAAGPGAAGAGHQDKAAPQAALSTAALGDVPAPENGAAAGNAARETLKGLLLQIAAADDLPAPLQDAAKQIIQQLTGQQLLLTTDRTTPFAQVTMFLPFIGPDGEQTASVHIESRRGRKGELDAANCRLWFDLQMKALGQIMVDVQVADKKVLLKIFSEQEIAGAFLESRQSEIESALETAGYRLLSLKAEPLISAGSEETAGHELGQSLSYAPSPYKGVDYRV
ncbi:flagellar hook-length control protein FliK [Fontibacillus sp. BL9]|uniref:flagellar hook-length control protein FliK n=1 Tax=Fontibacillus sp. BL9 TaxID=3389971 RepID=UPI00397C8639